MAQGKVLRHQERGGVQSEDLVRLVNDPLQYAAEDEETSGVSDDAVVHRDPPPPTGERRSGIRMGGDPGTLGR